MPDADPADPADAGEVLPSDMAFANFLESVAFYPARVESERFRVPSFDERPGSPKDRADRAAHDFLVEDFYYHRAARLEAQRRIGDMENEAWVDMWARERAARPQESIKRTLARVRRQSSKTNHRRTA